MNWGITHINDMCSYNNDDVDSVSYRKTTMKSNGYRKFIKHTQLFSGEKDYLNI